MTTLSFLHPWVLALLALLPLLAWWRGRRGRTTAVRVASLADARAAGALPRSRAGRFLRSLTLLALALLITALARPRLGRGSTEVDSSGIDIMLAVDVSGSMEALDFKLHGKPVNRLQVVKNVLTEFIAARPNDLLGLLAFAGRPYLVAPLTPDHEFLQKRLDSVQMGQVEDGTAIGSAIASGVSRLQNSSAKSKILILLTDGMNNAGSINPETAAETARALGIKVYTIAVGVRGEAPVPVRDPFGRTRLQMMKVEIDEESLQRIAEATGARFFRATDTDSLASIYESINQLEKTTRKLKKYQQYDELFAWFLLPGSLLLLAEQSLRLTRYRRLP